MSVQAPSGIVLCLVLSCYDMLCKGEVTDGQVVRAGASMT